MTGNRLGWSYSPKRPIFISLVVISTVLMIALCWMLIRMYSISNQSDRQTITFGVTLVGAVIAIYGLLRAADNIRQGNAEKFQAATLRLVERWNAPSYVEIRTQWRKLNQELDALSPKERDDVLAATVEKRSVAIEILNFFEEIATGVNNGSLDDQLLKSYFDVMAIMNFERYEYWVRQHRIRRSAPEFYEQIENLVTKWKKKT